MLWIRVGLSTLFAALLIGGGLGTAWSHGDHEGGTSVHPVIATELAETDGKHASMVTVTLEPGSHFDPHRHPGTVLVYVLEGEVESALDDEEPKRFKAGEAWTEHVGALHRVTRNGGKSTAKILAVLLHDEDAALQLPAE